MPNHRCPTEPPSPPGVSCAPSLGDSFPKQSESSECPVVGGAGSHLCAQCWSPDGLGEGTGCGQVKTGGHVPALWPQQVTCGCTNYTESSRHPGGVGSVGRGGWEQRGAHRPHLGLHLGLGFPRTLPPRVWQDRIGAGMEPGQCWGPAGWAGALEDSHGWEGRAIQAGPACADRCHVSPT